MRKDCSTFGQPFLILEYYFLLLNVHAPFCHDVSYGRDHRQDLYGFGAEATVLSTSPSKQEDATNLGAHRFVVTKEEEQVQKVAGYFDFIVDTVAAKHDYNLYRNMLKTKGTLICLGASPEPIEVSAFPLLFQGREIGGCLIGGIGETQEMLDYCVEHNITSDVEVIAIKDINQAYERMERSDVKYRFVIDLSTLE